MVINLKRRPDRLRQVRAALSKCHWPFKRPEAFAAIDGLSASLPPGWTHGHGAWGAMLSHRAILEAADKDGVNRLLVLEDDVCFAEDFRSRVELFLAAVPEDWDQLMIGGQHMSQGGKPTLVRPGVYRCVDCERMHCYAIRGRFMQKFLRRLHGGGKFNGLTHCDCILGRDPEMQRRHKVYAPELFLAGQERSQSDINHSYQPRKFWNPPGPELSVINLCAPVPVAMALHQRGFYWRHSFSGQDGKLWSLDEILVNAGNDSTSRTRALREFIIALQWEVGADTGFICTIWNPQVTLEMVKAASIWKVYDVTTDNIDDALKQLPRRLRLSLVSEK